ncbi:MAG: ABC transporter permease [Clostridiales bacterium]|nr:ABC transporter permease [Clostridiales bacterium]
MRRYVLRRLVLSAVTLIFVALVLYCVMRMIPTSFVEKKALERSQIPGGKSYSQWLLELRALYGLDAGVPEGFFRWLKSAVRFDFGDSWKYGVPVVEKFNEVIWDSFWLALAAGILRTAIAIPLGVLSARRQYRRTDYIVTLFALIGISLPTFFFATLLKLAFSVGLGWFELFGKIGRDHAALDAWEKALDIAKHYALPVATLTLVSIGDLTRHTRSNMLEVLKSDYVRTARAAGLPERTVMRRYAYRNTLVPTVTVLMGTLPGLFSGAMVTETLFQIPGIGYTAFQAMAEGDIPFTMFFSLFIAALTLLGTLAADLLYAAVDPRVRMR